MTAAARTELSLRSAAPSDRSAVEGLLDQAGLPRAGIPADLAHFVVAEHAGAVVAAAGLEPYAGAVLLRSVVVDPAWRGTGAGARVVDAALQAARRLQAREVYLLTTTAERWFPRFGFQVVDRSAVPAAVQASAEFRGACPATAVAMMLALH